MRSVRIGSGSASAEDRIEPALELAQYGDIQYLCFDTLSEKEIQTATLRKRRNPKEGFDNHIEMRLEPLLPLCAQWGIKLISNMGSANPRGAVQLIQKLCKKLGLKGLKIACILGDDVRSTLAKLDPVVAETGQPVSAFESNLMSANAYIGADVVVTALRQGADIVIGGRISDASLYLAPPMYEFGWRADDNDWDRLARGIIVGHILECAGHATGGNFADPGYKEVPDLHRLGFPIAEIARNGDAVITKVPGSGGIVTTATVTEQLLYEMSDPANYIEPDVTADITEARVEQQGKDRVSVRGVRGKTRPANLKVSLGVLEGFIGEGVLFFGGPGAVEKAKLAGEIVTKRLDLIGVKPEELRVDYIGINALFHPHTAPPAAPLREVGLRVAGRTKARADAAKIAYEVYALPTNGPSGISAGAIREGVTEVLGYYHTFIPRERVKSTVAVVEVK
ncbi:MAG: DUF1446 domain-containing protein [candidate division NC10 bacterium]|nr:DUF1446 domain-containing protein [candidate division NC10 bacterium]